MAAKAKSKAVIIDTEQNSKAFYLQMFAFLTGQEAGSVIASKIADDVSNEIVHLTWWEQNIIDEPGGKSPDQSVSIWRTPGWFDDAAGEHFRDTEENFEKAQKAAIEKVRDDQEQVLAPIIRRMEENDFSDDPNSWTKANCERAVKIATENIAAAREADPRRPSYMSVAIFVENFPPQAVIDEMIERLDVFVETRGTIGRRTNTKIKNLTITGVRAFDPETGTSQPLGSAIMAA